jgi:DHA3 family macrolide efflux protein-like MFS transporter
MASNIEANTNWKKPFFLIWAGQAFSLLGSSLVQFALVWWLTRTTGSATVLAAATLVALLPEVFLGPFAGALVDRWNRRRVMIFADAAIALVTLGLAVLFWQGIVQVWHIYVALFIRSRGSSFHWPAMQASTSLMVPDDQLSRISGLNQALRGGMAIIAPPLGALLMELLPIYGVLSVDILTAIIAIFPLLIVPIPQPKAAVSQEILTPKRLWQDIVQGARFLATWPGALSLVLLASFLNFMLAPSGTLMPLLVKNHFNGTAWHLSALEAAVGIGIVIGGLVLGTWGGFKKRIITSLSGVVGIGLGVLLTGLVPNNLFYLAVGGVALMGFMSPIANGPLHAIMQARVPPEMQGRVFTLIGSACAAMMPISMLVAAPIAEWLGVRAWFLLGGGATILMGSAAFMNKKIIHIEDEETTVKKTAPTEVIA